jgi:hypothetical protein
MDEILSPASHILNPRRLPALALLISSQLFAAAPKVHTVTLGPLRKVPYTQPDATPDTKSDETSTLKVRPLFVDDRQKEWTMGEVHDITDRTFAIRRALHINDSLSSDTAPRWIWQPGPWIAVDRVTGHITALHLPDFDPIVSTAVWFRDYAAYCGTSSTAKGGLLAIVAQLGAPATLSCRNRSANGHKLTTLFQSANQQNGSASPPA